MPLQYEGVIAEHMAVRSGVGVFDVSHLGRFSVSGAGAVALVRRQLCNDISRIAPGRAQYTMALNPRGGVLDDIIVWWINPDTLWVMPNGVNFDGILDRFRSDAPSDVAVDPVRDSTVLVAIQGPRSSEVLEAVLGAVPPRFRVETGVYANTSYVAAGTGYTGERGAEVAVPAAAGPALWDTLVEAGATPCGLGSRDTLRLEMGYPLWGQDLDEDATPLEAGLAWAVEWEHDFVGRDALLTQRQTGPSRQLVSFRLDGRQIARHGYAMRVGPSTGSVTSGNFSPVLKCGIGMGYVSPPPAGDDRIEVEIRGSWLEGTLVEPPFIQT